MYHTTNVFESLKIHMRHDFISTHLYKQKHYHVCHMRLQSPFFSWVHKPSNKIVSKLFAKIFVQMALLGYSSHLQRKITCKHFLVKFLLMWIAKSYCFYSSSTLSHHLKKFELVSIWQIPACSRPVPLLDK